MFVIVRSIAPLPPATVLPALATVTDRSVSALPTTRVCVNGVEARNA